MELKRWDVLNELIADNGYKTVVEIGVRKGRNMGKILRRNKEIFWYAIDPWVFMKSYPRWDQALHDSCYQQFLGEKNNFPDRVKELKMYSVEAVDLVPNDIDLLFIDGDHEYSAAKLDIELYAPKVRPGGMVSGHDYDNLPRFPGVKQAVDETFPEVNLEPDWVWWVKV